MRVLIVDGYTDEPAALGVPPYIAPLPRYIAGAALDAGAEAVGYVTIDELRAQGRPRRGVRERRDGRGRRWDGRGRDRAGGGGGGGGSGGAGGGGGEAKLRPPGGRWAMLVAIGGAVVPGRYLRGRPASGRELGELAAAFEGPSVLAGAVARWGWTSGSAIDPGARRAFRHVATADADAYVHDLVDGDRLPRQRARTVREWARWPVLGATLAARHPDFPRPLVAEVETYRGCVRHAFGGCSFCTTVRDGPPKFRAPGNVAKEVAALAGAGVVAFRLGGQSCIYSYMAEGVGEDEAPTPSPAAVARLLEGVRAAAPALEVLHVDNANPAVIAEHPGEAEEVTRLLVRHCTGGNVVALGLESADPAVFEANSLNATAGQCLEAIRLVGRVGGARGPTGLPNLLPGINLLAGLRGETPATFDMDRAFLQGILDEGLLVRRTNIRQVAPVCAEFDVRRHHREFLAFKEWARTSFDRPMLERLLPFGTVLRGVWPEVHDGGTTFGRQMGSYPILVGVSARLELRAPIDAAVVSWGPRSVEAVPYPLRINDCPMSLLSAVPGIGRKRAARIVLARPIKDLAHLRRALDEPGAADALGPLAGLPPDGERFEG